MNSVDMDAPRIYEIRVEGHLTDRWSDWFEGMAIRQEPDGETVLTGPLSDQAALFGVLTRIHDLNLVLVSVRRVSPVE
jgi:hypothetical protein